MFSFSTDLTFLWEILIIFIRLYLFIFPPHLAFIVSDCANFVNISLFQIDPVPRRKSQWIISCKHHGCCMNGVHERGKFLEVMMKNTYVSQTAMYSNIEMLPSPLKSAFSKISQRAKHGVDYPLKHNWFSFSLAPLRIQVLTLNWTNIYVFLCVFTYFFDPACSAGSSQ